MKTLRFLALVLLSAAVSFTAAALLLLVTGSGNVFFSTAVFGGILVALALGAFSE